MHHIRVGDCASRFHIVPQGAVHRQPYYSRELFEANSDAIVVTDAHGIISDVNEEMVRISGITRSELIGSNWFDLIPNTVRAGIEYARALTEGRASNVELVIKSRSGDDTSVIYNAAPIFDHQTNPVGVFATLRDATDLMRMRHDLEEKNAEVSRANQMKADFLANMSHELRTPLTAILGFSEALLCGVLGDIGQGQTEYIQDIHNSGQHLLELITDILDLAQIDAGMMPLHLETADLKLVLAHSVTQLRQQLDAPHIKLEIDEECGPSAIQLDLRKTQKIIEHIVSNAVKFSAPDGDIRVHACHVPRSAVGQIAGDKPQFAFTLPASDHSEFIQLTVHDSGVGIAARNLPKVFQIFNQVDRGLERLFEGVGLGASMVQRLAELQEGTTAIASVEGEGTSFAVWLPVRAEAASLSYRPSLRH